VSRLPEERRFTGEPFGKNGGVTVIKAPHKVGVQGRPLGACASHPSLRQAMLLTHFRQ